MNSYPMHRKTVLLGLLVLIIVGVTFAQLLSRFREVFSAADTPTPYPSDYPPDKQTREAEVRQTDEAFALTPFPTGTIWYFPPVTTTPIPEVLTPLPSTPAGDGEIIYRGADTAIGRILGIAVVNRWYEEASGRIFNVLAGSDTLDETQGMVYVVESLPDHTELDDGGYYFTPTKAGPVRVVDAQGERLILQAEDGTTFYFDVRGQTFVSSLSEVVPTMTFWPTPPPRPTKTPTTPAFTDDLPNDPYDVLANSPVNTNLRFVINTAGDLDWFRFFVPMTTTLQIHLESLPANYDLYVYSATYPRDILGISRKSNKGAEVVILKDAPPDDYYVLVTSVNGSFDATNPYQLRFEVPGLPIGGTPQP